jgi:hypothetical protein
LLLDYRTAAHTYMHPSCIPAHHLHADYSISLRGLEDEELEAAKSECHQRSASRLVNLCFANGGIYIKLGQHIGLLVGGCMWAGEGGEGVWVCKACHLPAAQRSVPRMNRE